MADDKMGCGTGNGDSRMGFSKMKSVNTGEEAVL